MAIGWDRRVLLSFQKWKRWIQNTGLSDARRSWIFYLIIELWIIVTRQLLKLQLWYFGNWLRPQGTSVIPKMKALNSKYRTQWRASKLDILSNHRTLNNHNKTITEITTLIFWPFVETTGYFCHSKDESAEFKLPASVTLRSWIFYLIIEIWIIITRQLLKLQLWSFGSLLRQQGTSVIQKLKALKSNYRPQWRFEVGSFIWSSNFE